MGKKVTLEEIAAAIQKNGWKKHKGWITYDEKGRVAGGCAMAQGAINLGVSYSALSNALAEITVIDKSGNLVKLNSWIMSQNDGTEITVGELGRLVGRRVTALRLMEFDLPTETYKTA